MKTKIGFVLYLSALVSLSSCIYSFDNSVSGNGDVVTEVWDVKEFHGIKASNGLHVFVEFGEFSDEVEVVADENLHEYIRVESVGGILHIKSEKNIRNASSKDVFVKAGMIDDIDLSSAARLSGEGVLEVDDVDIDVSSAAHLILTLYAREVDLDISSSGSARLEGEADEMDADISSAGNLHAGDFIVKEVDMSVSSAGDADIHVTEILRANASSAGSIKYLGNPEDTNISSSSAGNVRKR